MKRGGDLHPARPDCWPPNRAAPGNSGRADRRQCDVLVSPGGCAPGLAHVPSFGRNPRGSPDFLAYPVPKACMHVLGTGVPRCLGVARSASSPKAAQALGCSLIPGSGSRLAGSPAWHRLPQCPGYGQWVSYCCVVFVIGSGFCLGVGFGNPASPGWGLRWVCLGTVCGVAPILPAGVCGVCGWAWVSACTPPFLVRILGRAWLFARSACTPLFPVLVYGVGLRAGVCVSAAPCWGVCVLVCPFRVVSCTSWLGVLCGGVWLGLGLCRAPPLLAGALGRVCVSVHAPLVPRLSWPGYAAWACVLGSGFGCAPPLLVGLLGCVCRRACASLAPALPGGRL